MISTWTNTENVLLSTQTRIFLKKNVLVKIAYLTPSPLKKTNQIYTNLKNCLDLCQKNWNQSKYWKLPYVTTDLLHKFKCPFRSTSVYRGVLMLVNGVRSLVFWVVFCRSLFVLFLFFVVLSVLRFTASKYLLVSSNSSPYLQYQWLFIRYESCIFHLLWCWWVEKLKTYLD